MEQPETDRVASIFYFERVINIFVTAPVSSEDRRIYSGRMSWLITYPQTAIPEDLAQRLAKSSNTIYCPLRFLEPLPLDARQRADLLAYDRLIITSNFALRVFLSDIARPWADMHPHGTLLVLSQAMLRKIRDEDSLAHIHVHIPQSENRESLLELLHSLPNDRTALLCGDIALRGTRLPERVRSIPIYTNQWNEDHEQRAARIITNAMSIVHRPDHGDARDVITRILVTSPSAYRRLWRLRERLPECFSDRPELFALGPSTAQETRIHAETAKTPADHRDVLRKTIELMLDR